MSNSTTKDPPRLHVSSTQIPSFDHFKHLCRWVGWPPCPPPSWSTSCLTWWPGRGRRWCPSAPRTQTRFKFKLSKSWFALGHFLGLAQDLFLVNKISTWYFWVAIFIKPKNENKLNLFKQGLVKLHKSCVNSIFKGTSFYQFMDLIDFQRYISLRADHAMR